MRKYLVMVIVAALGTLTLAALFVNFPGYLHKSDATAAADSSPYATDANDVTPHLPADEKSPEASDRAQPQVPPSDENNPAAPTTPSPRPVPVPIPPPTAVGVPTGTKLQIHKGDLVITEAGKTVKNVEVRGAISVRAPNVTIKNSRIVGQKPVDTGLVASRSTGLRIIDSEIWSAHRNPTTNGVMGSGFTLERVEIRSVVDQVHIHGAGNVTIRDSWLHSNVHYAKDPNWNGGPSHDDNIQITSGHNIKIINSQLTGAHNAAIMITRGSGSVGNLQISGNRIGGGGCSINIAPGPGGPIEKLRIANNVFYETQRVGNCAVIAPREYKSSLTANRWAGGSEVRLSNAG